MRIRWGTASRNKKIVAVPVPARVATMIAPISEEWTPSVLRVSDGPSDR